MWLPASQATARQERARGDSEAGACDWSREKKPEIKQQKAKQRASRPKTKPKKGSLNLNDTKDDWVANELAQHLDICASSAFGSRTKRRDSPHCEGHQQASGSYPKMRSLRRRETEPSTPRSLLTSMTRSEKPGLGMLRTDAEHMRAKQREKGGQLCRTKLPRRDLNSKAKRHTENSKMIRNIPEQKPNPLQLSKKLSPALCQNTFSKASKI